MKKTLIALTVTAGLCLAALPSFAGFGGYSPYTILFTTNAPNFITNYSYVQIPQVTFTATATNLVSQTTNNIVTAVNTASGTLIVQQTFVYNSGVYGTNFSTNFPAQTIVVPVLTGFQVVPQTTASNFVQETVN